MRIFFVFTAALLLCAGCGDDANNPVADGDDSVITFEKVIGGASLDYGYSVAVTDDGGYFVAGQTHSFESGFGVYLIRLEASGDTLWTEKFSRTVGYIANSIDQTKDGGFVITGHISPGGGADRDVLLIKIDAVGDTMWTRSFGGEGADIGNEVRTASDGGFFVVGSTSSFGEDGDVWLIRTNSNGDTLWTRTFGGAKGQSGKSLALTEDGGCIIVGNTGDS